MEKLTMRRETYDDDIQLLIVESHPIGLSGRTIIHDDITKISEIHY